jgi:serine/threonine-protein kinase RsbW
MGHPRFHGLVMACVDNSTAERQTTHFAKLGDFFAHARCARGKGPAGDGFGVRGVFTKSLPMTEQRVSYTLDSTLETVDSAEQAANRIATEAGFGDDEIMQISMAVREAAVNAVLHGNAYDPEKKVKLEFEMTGHDLVITIRDQGKGLDPAKIPDPLAPENLLKTSGRGIFLIRSFMDEVQIQPSHTGTEIKLIKHVPGTSGSGKEASQ